MKAYDFGTLFRFEPKSRHKAAHGNGTGKYPFYRSSMTLDKWCDKPDHTPGKLVFGTGGNASIHYASTPFSTSSDCLVAAPIDPDRVSAAYVYHYLSSHLHLLESGFRGAGLKHISKKYIATLSIPCPSLATQKSIVALLGRVDAIRQKRSEAQTTANSLLGSVFVDMFGDPVLNSRGLPTSRLDEIAAVGRGKFTPRPRNDPKYYGGEYPFIQTGNVASSDCYLTSWSQTLNELGTGVSKQFPRGTVVIAIVGATIGETAILDIDCYCPDSVVGIQPKPGVACSEYIEYALRFWKLVFRAQAPETARANINLETLRPLVVPCPPYEEQCRFAVIYRHLHALRRKQSMHCEELYGSIVQQAFDGRLAVASEAGGG